MVLAELGNKITNALRVMNNATVIDDEIVEAMLKEIGNALIQADVAVNLVIALRKNIKNKIKLEELAAGLNKRKIIKQVGVDKPIMEEANANVGCIWWVVRAIGSWTEAIQTSKGKVQCYHVCWSTGKH